MQSLLMVSIIGTILALSTFLLTTVEAQIGSTTNITNYTVNNMTIFNPIKYSDLNGRFSILYPGTWTVVSNKFENPLVKIELPVAFASGGINVSILSSPIKDPEVSARQLANVGGHRYTLFQNVECTKYEIDGQKACSFILTKPVGVTIMQVISYINGKMYAITSGATGYRFDWALPVFQVMLASFKAPA
jgi:hypothetical protein